MKRIMLVLIAGSSLAACGIASRSAAHTRPINGAWSPRITWNVWLAPPCSNVCSLQSAPIGSSDDGAVLADARLENSSPSGAT